MEAEPAPIRLIVVDDHPVVRRGLSFSFLSVPDIDLVGAAEDGAGALRLCAEERPDVVLLDMKMPDMDGVGVTRAIRAAHPQTQVLVLSSFAQAEQVQGALREGAIGYLLKDIAFEEIARAIRLAHAGQSTISPAALRSLHGQPSEENEAGYDLTARQIEVLALLAEGLHNEEIATRLNISLSTVRFHISNIFSKLGAANRAEAAAMAVKLGLLAEE